jgi:hypothetical protein
MDFIPLSPVFVFVFLSYTEYLQRPNKIRPNSMSKSFFHEIPPPLTLALSTIVIIREIDAMIRTIMKNRLSSSVAFVRPPITMKIYRMAEIIEKKPTNTLIFPFLLNPFTAIPLIYWFVY